MGEIPLVNRRRLSLTARELRGQLTILVVVLWSVALLNSATPGIRLLSGQIKGTDFLHFFALARVGATAPSAFADAAAVRQAQLHAVPGSEDHLYPPVYGPQVALALAPLASFEYLGALALWVLISTVFYFAAVAIVMRRSPVVGHSRAIVVLAAAGFPPFWYLLQFGQLSVVPLCLFVAAWSALRHRRRLAAGVILGLLVFKPPLFAPVFAVVLLGGSWMVASGMALGAAAEIAPTLMWVGVDGLNRYYQLLLDLPGMASMMAAKPYQMHSFRAFWLLLVPDQTTATVLYAVTAGAAVLVAARVWRSAVDLSLRMSALVLATALAAPHLYVYDLVILAPAWIWLTEWFLTHRVPAAFGRALYAGYVLTLVGEFSQLVRVQVSVLCLAYLLVGLVRWASATVQESSERSMAGEAAERGLVVQSAQESPILGR